jgi:hypothetical protein
MSRVLDGFNYFWKLSAKDIQSVADGKRFIYNLHRWQILVKELAGKEELSEEDMETMVKHLFG